MWPSSPARTCSVESPSHTTSAKYLDTWFRACARISGSWAEVSIARHDPRLVPRMPIRSYPSSREPCHGPTGVDDGLPAHLDGSRHVGADDEVGSIEGRGHPPVVVRQAQAQGIHAETRQQPAEPDMPARVRVPLRQHHDRPTPVLGPALPPRRREQPPVDHVVLGMGRGDDAWERNRAGTSAVPCPVGFPGEIARRGRLEEPRSIGERTCRPVGQHGFGRRVARVAVRVHPLETPVEGPDDAIRRACVQAAFPGVEQRSEHQGAIVPNSWQLAADGGPLARSGYLAAWTVPRAWSRKPAELQVFQQSLERLEDG